MDKLTMILQDAPYGSEKAYNAFRYASALLANQVTVNLFLLADGVGVAKRGQKRFRGTCNSLCLEAWNCCTARRLALIWPRIG